MMDFQIHDNEIFKQGGLGQRMGINENETQQKMKPIHSLIKVGIVVHLLK